MTSGPVKWGSSLLLGSPVNYDPNDSTPLSETSMLSAARTSELLKFRTAQSAAQLDPPSNVGNQIGVACICPRKAQSWGAHNAAVHTVCAKMRNAPSPIILSSDPDPPCPLLHQRSLSGSIRVHMSVVIHTGRDGLH